MFTLFQSLFDQINSFCASSVFDDGRKPCFFDSVFRFKEVVKFNGIYAVLFRRVFKCEIAITFRFFVVRKDFQHLFIVIGRKITPNARFAPSGVLPNKYSKYVIKKYTPTIINHKSARKIPSSDGIS